MDIEKRFLMYLDNSIKNDSKQYEDMFVNCPKVFYYGLSEGEISSMQQIYSIAYEKARAKTKNIYNSYEGFCDGSGI